MRRRIGRIALIAFTVLGLMPLAPSASAMTCEINDGGHIDPSPGDAACAVIITVVGPVCDKFGCG